jgi:hypothetical protein
MYTSAKKRRQKYKISDTLGQKPHIFSANVLIVRKIKMLIFVKPLIVKGGFVEEINR